MDIRFIIGERQNVILVADNFKYYNNFIDKQDVYLWRCIKKGCPAKLYTEGKTTDVCNINKCITNHNHSEEAHIKRQEASALCKNKALESFAETPAKVIRGQLSKFTNENDLTTADTARLRRNIYYSRQKVYPRLPKSILEVNSYCNMSKRSSIIWKYFDDQGSTRAKCRICSKLLSFKSGSQQNLWRHMKTVHVALSKTQLPKRTDFNNKKLDEYNAAAPSTSVSPTTINSRPTNDDKSIGIIKKPVSDETMKDLNVRLVDMLVKNYLPFNIVESTAFKSFLSSLNPDYQLPNKKTLTSSLVPEMCKIIKEKITENICCTESLCLTIDSWISATNRSYITVSAHFITDFTLESNLLECIAFTDRNAVKDVFDEIVRVAKDWNIENKILAIVTDNTAIMKDAAEASGYKHVVCFAHNLNTIVQTSISVISYIINKVDRIVDFFIYSHEAAEKLKQRQIELYMPILNIKQNVGRRWNSTFKMFNRIIEINDSLISTIVLYYPHLDNLINEDIKVISQCCSILEFFNSAVDEMSREKLVPLSKVILIVNGLKKCCTSYLNNELEPASEKLCGTLLENLKEKFADIESDDIYSTATLLDPRFKQHGFSTNQHFEAAKISVENELYFRYNNAIIKTEEIDITSNGTENVENKYNSIWTDFDTDVSKHIERLNDSSSKTLKELECYLQEPLLPRQADPIMWWKDRNVLYPYLLPIAISKLSVISTCVPSKRLFSQSGQILSEARSHLCDKRVSEMVFLNANI